MNLLWERILESKRAERRRLAALPIEEKLVLLEKMRDRAYLLAAARKSLQNKSMSDPKESEASHDRVAKNVEMCAGDMFTATRLENSLLVVKVATIDGWEQRDSTDHRHGSKSWWKNDIEYSCCPFYVNSREDAINAAVEWTKKSPNSVKKFVRALNQEVNNESSQSVPFWSRMNEFDLMRLISASARDICVALVVAAEEKTQ